MMRGKKPASQIRIAEERIVILLSLAKKEFSSHPDRSRRYVELARKIGLRYNVKLTKEQKRGFCKRCSSIMIPGRIAQVRIDSDKKIVETKCLKCGHVYKHPFTKSKNI
jgi:ribonuclease P protein subunit RPR2